MYYHKPLLTCHWCGIYHLFLNNDTYYKQRSDDFKIEILNHSVKKLAKIWLNYIPLFMWRFIMFMWRYLKIWKWKRHHYTFSTEETCFRNFLTIPKLSLPNSIKFQVIVLFIHIVINTLCINRSIEHSNSPYIKDYTVYV